MFHKLKGILSGHAHRMRVDLGDARQRFRTVSTYAARKHISDERVPSEILKDN